jgi:hypothetical protein
MKQPSDPEKLKQFLSVFSQLGAILAAITLLIQLLSADLDAPYRQTLSALAVLALTVLLWLWRWPKITQGRTGRNPTTPTKRKAPTAENLFKPFRTVRGNPYQFSLARRRTEGIFLSLVSVLVLVFVLQKSGRIGEEISGVQCSYAATREAPLLVITAFKDFNNQPTAFVNRLYTEMDEQFGDEVSVCLSRHVISNGNEAEAYGRRLNRRQSTTVVVWGDSDAYSSEIHLTPIEWTAFELLIKADAADASEMEGWARDYVPQIVLGMTQFIAGDNRTAIRTFDTVIKKLEAEPWTGDNQEALARLYFRLAQLYRSENQTTSAIAAYDQVLANDSGFHAARLARGVLYMDTDREKALADFNVLIDQGTNLAAQAYVNRASLQTEWDLRKSDYLKAIELEPEDPDNYHFLGLSALETQEYDTAIKAYEDARPFLDDDARTDIIEELRAAAEENSALAEVVQQIITLLNEPPP